MPGEFNKFDNKDENLLYIGGSTIIGGSGGREAPPFGYSIRDFVHFNLYDFNNEYRTSGTIVDFKDNDEIRLKPGNEIRSSGAINQPYNVDYNFFRELAGSDAKVLLRTSFGHERELYTAPIEITGQEPSEWFMSDGKIWAGEIGDVNPEELVEENYKLYVHKISATRKEIRLAPFDIKYDKYNSEFENLYTITKKYISVKTGKYGDISFQGTDGQGIGDSKILNLFKHPRHDEGFSIQMLGADIKIENAFIVDYETTTDEVTGGANPLKNPGGDILKTDSDGAEEQDFSNFIWEPELHQDAIKVQNWSTGLNSGVDSAEQGYHAKWVANEGRDSTNCMKFIDMNDYIGAKHRWSGISQNIGSLAAAGLSEGDEIKIEWWQKTNVAGKGAQVGIYHWKGFPDYETMPSSPPLGYIPEPSNSEM